MNTGEVMVRHAGLLFTVWSITASGAVSLPPDPSNFHIFIMMGQSNMAGMGVVEAQDRVVHPRIHKWVNTTGWVEGQESFSQPYWGECGLGGQCLGPGRAFAQTLVDDDPSITVGVANIAFSGSAIESWVKGGEYYQRNLDWIALLRQGGTLKGMVWHQGEANSGPMDPSYGRVLAKMIADYRTDLGVAGLSFVAGMIGTAGSPDDGRVNFALDSLEKAGFPYFRAVSSSGTRYQDNVHYDNVSQRLMGQRYAEAYLSLTPVTGAVRGRMTVGRGVAAAEGCRTFDVLGRLAAGAAQPAGVLVRPADAGGTSLTPLMYRMTTGGAR